MRIKFAILAYVLAVTVAAQQPISQPAWRDVEKRLDRAKAKCADCEGIGKVRDPSVLNFGGRTGNDNRKLVACGRCEGTKKSLPDTTSILPVAADIAKLLADKSAEIPKKKREALERELAGAWAIIRVGFSVRTDTPYNTGGPQGWSIISGYEGWTASEFKRMVTLESKPLGKPIAVGGRVAPEETIDGKRVRRIVVEGYAGSQKTQRDVYASLRAGAAWPEAEVVYAIGTVSGEVRAEQAGDRGYRILIVEVSDTFK